MSEKRGKKTHKVKAETPPKPEAAFPSYLSPIIGCPKKVLERSRLEFYLALIISIIAAVLPMTSITRSLLLLLVLIPLVDIAWRSPWFHLMSRTLKVIATILLIGIYLAVAATLILHEHESAALAVKAYLNSGRAEWLFRWFYFLAGVIATYLLLKLFSLLKAYVKNRRAEKLAIRKMYRETQKGWLDYRLESEESSKRLHFLAGRMARELVRLGYVLKFAPWIVGKEGKTPAVVRTQAVASLITTLCERYSTKMEAELEELEATANTFIESTEGHLRTLEIATRRDYEQLAGLHEYFQVQSKNIHELANAMVKLPPAFEELRGISQDSTAAINRQVNVWKSQVAIMRKIEGHCARMVKVTQAHFNRSVKAASLELLSAIKDIVRRMEKKASGIRE